MYVCPILFYIWDTTTFSQEKKTEENSLNGVWRKVYSFPACYKKVTHIHFTVPLKPKDYTLRPFLLL